MDNVIKHFERIRKDDTEAFRKIFLAHSDKFYLLAFKIVGDSYAAEDIVQSFFVRLWEKRKALTFSDEATFFAYSYRAIYNASLNWIRDHERYSSYQYNLFVDIVETEDKYDVKEELIRLLEKAIEELPMRCKQIFKMARIERKSYSEIADELSISENTVKTQVSKAYHILRKKVG